MDPALLRHLAATMPRAVSDPRSFARLAGNQAGVASRGQLREMGVDWHAVEHRIKRGVWRPVTPLVVALTTGPLDTDQRHWSALLHAGQGGALAGSTAAARRGLRGYEDAGIHVLVPPGRRVPPSPELGIRPHWTERLQPEHLAPARHPAATSLERSIIDMAAWATNDDRAAAVLAAAVQQRLTTADRLVATVTELGRMRRRRLVLEVLADVRGGSHSLPEREAYLLCRRFGIPLPERQQVRLDASGGRRYLDLFWPRWRLVVEIDGAFHMEWQAWEADLERTNHLALTELTTLRFTAVAIRIKPAAVAAVIRKALQMAGWEPRRKIG